MVLSKGFTLIELMIVVAIIGALAAVASPLTQEWYNTAKVNESIGFFQEAYSRTKALALLNNNQLQGNTATSFLCINNNTLYLYNNVPSACNVSGYVWSGRVPGAPVTEISLNGTTWNTCIALNNQGLPSNSTFNGSICPSQRNISIIRGNSNANTILY